MKFERPPFSTKAILSAAILFVGAYFGIILPLSTQPLYSGAFWALALLGGLVLAPLATAFGRVFGTGIFSLFLFMFLGVGFVWFYPHIPTFLMLFVIFFAVPIVQNIIFDRTDSLYIFFMHGLPPVFLLIGLVSVLSIRAHYGVYDFEGFYNSILAGITEIIDHTIALYQQLPAQAGDAQQTMIALLEATKGKVDLLAGSLLMTVVVVIMGQFFWNLLITRAIFSNSERPLPLQPLHTFVLPRVFANIYILLYLVDIFVSQTVYALGMQVALTLYGWLFVLVGIGTVERWLMRTRTPRALHTFINFVLLILSFFSMNGSLLGAYNILLIIGLLISSSVQTVIIRKTSDKDE